MGRGKTIDWHRRLRLGDLKRRYRRFREGHIPEDDLLAMAHEFDHWYDDFDDYWDPYHEADALDCRAYRFLSRILSGGFNRIVAPEDGLLSKALQASEARHTTMPGGPTRSYLPDELPRALSQHLHKVNAPQYFLYDLSESKRERFSLRFPKLWRMDPTCGESIGALEMASLLGPFWIRPISSWTGRNSYSDNMILSLVDHLFVRYPVPSFLYRNWLGGWDLPRAKWVYWFVLLGQGASLHRAARYFDNWNVPRGFTRYLYEAPNYLTPIQACMWAEVMRLGGTEIEFQRFSRNEGYVIDPTRRSDPEDSLLSFWRETIRWLIKYRDELTNQSSRVILDWAMFKYGAASRAPRFSWRGRKPGPAHEAAMAWRTPKIAVPNRYHWKNCHWDWEMTDDSGCKWSIRELISEKELRQEGLSMYHWVQNYAKACFRGDTAIFSLAADGERRLTVQVNPYSGNIIQARGFRNRPPDSNEQAVLDMWSSHILQQEMSKILGLNGSERYRFLKWANDLGDPELIEMIMDREPRIGADSAEALELFVSACQDDMISVIKSLAERGVPVERDDYQLKVPLKSYASVMLRLADMYCFGNGVIQDYDRAQRYYRKASEHGEPSAMNQLGVMYQDGQGVKQDQGEAISWFIKAAEQGSGVACHNLGLLYRKGQGVEQDYTRARRYFAMALNLDRNAVRTVNQLGEMYLNGEGLPQDYDKAFRFFINAAEEGQADAAWNLGHMYLREQGVHKDIGEAVQWFRKAAEHGHKDAEELLRKMGEIK